MEQAHVAHGGAAGCVLCMLMDGWNSHSSKEGHMGSKSG